MIDTFGAAAGRGVGLAAVSADAARRAESAAAAAARRSLALRSEAAAESTRGVRPAERTLRISPRPAIARPQDARACLGPRSDLSPRVGWRRAGSARRSGAAHGASPRRPERAARHPHVSSYVARVTRWAPYEGEAQCHAHLDEQRGLARAERYQGGQLAPFTPGGRVLVLPALAPPDLPRHHLSLRATSCHNLSCTYFWGRLCLYTSKLQKKSKIDFPNSFYAKIVKILHSAFYVSVLGFCLQNPLCCLYLFNMVVQC